MGNQNIDIFIQKIGERLGAAECMGFSGRTESIEALFEAFGLGMMDCVYVSALAPSWIIKAVISCGAVPMLCDVTPDSLTIDYRSLEAAVKHTMDSKQLYPRALIIDNFCGMPFALKPVKSVCDRMGLIFIENCGCYFGGVSDGIPCGSVGDYSLISLGDSSVFGTGGSGSLVVSLGGSPLSEGMTFCDGAEYQPIDGIYGENLLTGFYQMDDLLEKSRAAAKQINDIISDSDFWIQRRGNSRQIGSFGATAIIAQSEDHCSRAIEFLNNEGLEGYIKPLHVHKRTCFGKACRGFDNIENAALIAPRAFIIDIFAALHSGNIDRVMQSIENMAKKIYE